MSDQTYKIVAFDGPPRDWEYQGNNFRSYYCKFEGDERRIEIAQKPETPAPNIGDTLTGVITEKNGYFKFKKARPGGGFGGNGGSRPKDPAERESIERQVAAKCATELLVGFMGTGWKPESVNALATQHTALAKQIAGEIKL